MESPARPSRLHELFRIPLGEASPLFHPTDRCEGMGFFEGLATTLIAVAVCSGFGVFYASPLFLTGLLAFVPGVPLMRQADRFTSRERLARAQKRRATAHVESV